MMEKMRLSAGLEGTGMTKRVGMGKHGKWP